MTGNGTATAVGPACSFDKKVEAIVVEQQQLGHVPEIESNTTPSEPPSFRRLCQTMLLL
jgi:hypothetical protein